MKVYLIRHAQSCDNARGLRNRLSPTAFNAFLREMPYAPLTIVGIQQAKRTASMLADTLVDRLYTSPDTRALMTAIVLGQAWNLPPQILPDLREIRPRLLPESQQQIPLFWLFLRGYLRLATPSAGHESWFAIYRRARGVWQALIREPVPAIAVVSHYAFLPVLLMAACVQQLRPLHQYHPENGGVTCIDVPWAYRRC